MNEQLIEFAVEAGLAYKTGSRWWIDAGEVDIHLERFAELVRQDERELCAKLCEDQIKSYMSKRYTTDPLGGYRERFASEQCAKAIRARGNT